MDSERRHTFMPDGYGMCIVCNTGYGDNPAHRWRWWQIMVVWPARILWRRWFG